ncbi:hypothetical protein [Brevundimonas sp.]|uniref:hypothetical protein n=1 Tax=Brevundimonas sp. TaxID=1871086 RepID=UPI002899FDE7|nr:hypothetical protein [Brevundimonas sp.]
MTTRSIKPPARMRRHADAPANWQWRPRPDGTGRPRWIPSPTLRNAGWKARDLKDGDGAFLSEGLSRDAARDINAAVAAWRRGERVSADFAAIAPPGTAEEGCSILPQAVDRLSIGRLIDAYFDSREFQGAADAHGQQTGGLRPSTQRGYRTSLKRLVDTLAGFVALPAADDPDALDRYTLAVATVRAAHISILKPVETKTGMVNLLYTAYWNLHEQSGQHQAYAVLAAASAWLKWAQKHQSDTVRQSWASEVSRTTPPGRIRPLTWEEIKALVTAADAMGLPSIGDAVILGLDLSWSQIDRLSLTWDRLKNGRAFTGSTGRIKTGRVGGAPLTSLGRARVAQILQRQRAMAARPTHVLWCELTDRPWEGDHFRKQFAKVREQAAKQVPSVASARDQDLRDTAFTWMKNAGLSDDGIASRTLQSRQHIAQLGDANYGAIGPEIADPAMRQFEAYLDKIGAVL